MLQELEKDYVVKLPHRVALDFDDSCAMTQFREQQAALNQHAGAADQYRDEAMRQAVGEEGPTRHEFMQFAQQMASQAQGANATLQQGLQESARHQQQSMQQQAQEFGRQLAEERVRQDQRDKFMQQQMAELSKQRTIPPAPTPPVPGTADIQRAVQETAQQIKGETGGMFQQFSSGIAQQLKEAIQGMHGQSDQNLRHMLAMLQQQDERQRQRSDATLAALASSQGPPPGPPPGGAGMTVDRPASGSRDPLPDPVIDPNQLSTFAKDIMKKHPSGLQRPRNDDTTQGSKERDAAVL